MTTTAPEHENVMENSIEKVELELVLVDEEMAHEYLKSNIDNRKVKKYAVKKYVRDILAGKFLLSDSAICFDEDGKLINGQNRLLALIEAAKQKEESISLPFIVAFGLPRICATVMDQGMRRTDQDNLHFAGFEVENSHEANIVKHLLYPRTTQHKTNQHQVIKCYEMYSEEIKEILGMCMHFGAVNLNRIIIKGVIGRAYIQAKLNNNISEMELIQEFCEQFANKRPVIEDQELLGNVMVLREGILKHFPKGNSSHADQRATFEKYLKDIIDGKILKRIRLHPGSNAIIFPAVEL